MRALFPATGTFRTIGSKLLAFAIGASAVYTGYSLYQRWYIAREIDYVIHTQPVLCYNGLTEKITPFETLEYKTLDKDGLSSEWQRYWAMPGDHCIFVPLKSQ